MSEIVAGVDFGTQSVRVSIVDSERGPIGAGVAEYPVKRDKRDPDFATQSHASHMNALVDATRAALEDAKVSGGAIRSIALDTTGSTVIPVDDRLEPLDDYYLWCDHRAKDEAEEITAAANASGLPAIEWCGGVYSSEWGFAKLLHWLRHNPDKRARFATALEHCDMVAATLSGISEPSRVSRSVCAMGHKWLWSERFGGLPPEEFLTGVDPLFAGVEAGLSAVGDIFEAIASRANTSVAELSSRATSHHAGQTGLLRMAWDNGDRTVLVNASLGGVTFGWNLSHTAEDELFAAIEGTAMHTRIIMERMRQHGVPIERVIHGGGIPQKNDLLNQVYANVLNMPVLVPERPITSLGSAIFAFLAAGTFATIEDAQRALCPSYRVIEPRASESSVYERLHPLYRALYFSLGQRDSSPVSIGNVLPALRKIAADVRALS